jgi:hypothetical protein
VTLRIAPLASLLYRADTDLPKRGAARVTLKAAADLYTNLLRVTATAGTTDPLSVTFAVRRAGGKRWKRVSVDDGAPYRAFLDPAAYRRGEKVSVVAVALASDGAVATSPVLVLQPRR